MHLKWLQQFSDSILLHLSVFLAPEILENFLQMSQGFLEISQEKSLHHECKFVLNQKTVIKFATFLLVQEWASGVAAIYCTRQALRSPMPFFAKINSLLLVIDSTLETSTIPDDSWMLKLPRHIIVNLLSKDKLIKSVYIITKNQMYRHYIPSKKGATGSPA